MIYDTIRIMQKMPFHLTYYAELTGRKPFREWLLGLRDRMAVQRIAARLDRLEIGNLGDYKSVGSGVMELRIDYGPGYRVYYAFAGSSIVLLLLGGDKRTQQRDIETAQSYWRDYQER